MAAEALVPWLRPVLSPTTETITWDVENRPISITGGTSFVYDGDGNRVKKTENGQTILYINKYYEKNLTTSEATTYYYLGDKLVAKRAGTTLQYIHEDHLTGTSVVSSATGTFVNSILYTPYGSTRSGDVPTDKKFTGQRLDNTGLYYYGARYYDPTIGRFVSPDGMAPSFGRPQLLNNYSYVTNNPLRYRDPTGNVNVDSDGGGGSPTVPPPPQPPTDPPVRDDPPLPVEPSPPVTPVEPERASPPAMASGGAIAIPFGVGLAGVTVSPLAGVVAWIGAMGLFLQGDTNPDVLYAKSDKNRVDSVKSYVDVIQEHEGKISGSPSDPHRPDWESHIRKALNNIKNEMEKMGPVARQRAQDLLGRGRHPAAEVDPDEFSGSENMYSGDKDEAHMRQQRANAVLKMTDSLNAKFESLGVKRKSVLMAAADLADIYAYANDAQKEIELLLEIPSSDCRRLGRICVDLRVRLGEVKDHIQHSRVPLDYLADYCYKRAPPEDAPKT